MKMKEINNWKKWLKQQSKCNSTPKDKSQKQKKWERIKDEEEKEKKKKSTICRNGDNSKFSENHPDSECDTRNTKHRRNKEIWYTICKTLQTQRKINKQIINIEIDQTKRFLKFINFKEPNSIDKMKSFELCDEWSEKKRDFLC